MTSSGAVLIGVDVGGTTMSGGLVTPAGEILATLQTDTHRDGPGTAVEDLLRIIDELMFQALERGLSVAGSASASPASWTLTRVS